MTTTCQFLNALDQRANARLGVQIWHLRTDRDHYMSNCLNAHDQRANARSAHLIWHSRTDRDHFPNVTISARMLYYIFHPGDSSDPRLENPLLSLKLTNNYPISDNWLTKIKGKIAVLSVR